MQESPISSLLFLNVRGTSALSPAKFAFQAGKLAYAASGGVVVCHLDKNGSIQRQKLYVANYASTELSSANSYLNMVDSTPDSEVRKDKYGFPVGATFTHGGDNDDLRSRTQSDLSYDGAPTSPSKLKDKVRSISCIALAPNGKVLAIGETGYLPRILLFSLAPDSTGQPFAVIYEHSFGVKHIAFSPDLKHFCSLGLLLDGFLHVWKYTGSHVLLRAGNKCSSVVHDLLWHASEGGQIVTLGLRFLKVWTFEADGTTKTAVLKGRNVVLGQHLDCNLFEAVTINSDEIAIAGQNYLFVLSLDSLKLSPVVAGNFCGLLVDHDNQILYLFNQQAKLQELQLDGLETLEVSTSMPISPTRATQLLSKLAIQEGNAGPVVKSHNLSVDALLLLDDDEEIKILNKKSKEETSVVIPVTTHIGGMKRASSGIPIIFSKDGKIMKLEGSDTKLLTSFTLATSDHTTNELTAVDHYENTLFLGDKFGQLFVVDISQKPYTVDYQSKAHSSTINDIAYFKVGSHELLCSISRDRMIQIFRKADGKWDLMRTLPTHTANLLAVEFKDLQLFVCSADRSISIHEIAEVDTNGVEPIEVYQKKILSLKNTPTSMAISDKELVLSTNDRSLFVYDAHTLELKRTLKLYNEKTNDSLSIDNFALLTNNTIVVSSADRALRTFNLTTGKFLSIGYGHSESILGMFQDGSVLYSVGSDGCLFTWSLEARGDSPTAPDETETSFVNTDVENSPLMAKVARKIMPAMQLPNNSHSPRRIPSGCTDDVIGIEPESPTPRLSSATLKRLEAKRKLNEKSGSPLPKELTPSRTSPTRPRSPLRSLRPSSPVKTSSAPVIALVRNPEAYKVPVLNSHSLPQPKQSPSATSTSLPQPKLSPIATSASLYQPKVTSGESLERATAYLAIIKSHAQKGLFSESDKTTLKKDLHDILRLLEDEPDYNDMLEKYSTSLVKMVEEKLRKSV